MPKVECITPDGAMAPIGPYSSVTRCGSLIWISATAGVDSATGELAGPDVVSQTQQIMKLLGVMLKAAGSDMEHVTMVTVYLKNIGDFVAMNEVYASAMGSHRPARSCVEVSNLPKTGALITMSATAVVTENSQVGKR